MKKRYILAALLMALVLGAAVLVVGSAMLEQTDSPSLGCRIYADGELIYECAGAQPEDILLSLNLSGVEQLRVEYIGKSGKQVLTFPNLCLELHRD